MVPAGARRESDARKGVVDGGGPVGHGRPGGLLLVAVVREALRGPGQLLPALFALLPESGRRHPRPELFALYALHSLYAVHALCSTGRRITVGPAATAALTDPSCTDRPLAV
jgi:hypothetical protein